MAIGIETLHPGVYVVEIGGVPRVVGIAVNTAGFLGAAEKGPIDEALFISSLDQFHERYGEYFRGSYLEPAVRHFFEEGGRRCYISRVVGDGAQFAYTEIENLDQGQAAALVTSGNAEPFDLEPGQAVVLSINAGPLQTFTFNAAPAAYMGSGFTGLALNGLTLTVRVDNGEDQQITFSGLGSPETPENVALFMNARLRGCSIQVNGGELVVQSDTRGTDSRIDIVGGTALGPLGFSVTSVVGTGDVGDIENVTATEAANHINATLTGGSAAPSGTGRLEIRTTALGSAASIQIDGSTTAAGFGFDFLLHNGSDAAFVDALLIDAQDPGAWGNNVAITTTVWENTTAMPVSNGDTTIYMASIRDLRLGDVIQGYDPTDPTNSFTSIIYSIDVATKSIEVLPAVSSLSGSLPAGAIIRSSSMHRLSTFSTTDLENGDDTITVQTANSLKIGALITISDGTTMTEAQVTGIEGNVIKFAPVALTSTIASGAVVASQEFRMMVWEKGQLLETHSYLNMEDTPSTDYVVNRLNGISNDSLIIEVSDMLAAPPNDWQKIPRPVTLQFLADGADGLTPTDNDYIGSSTDPKSGLYLFDDVIDLNFFAIPGITTVDVQTAAVGYADGRQDTMVILDAPEWTDLPQEVYNYRMFELNADSSYAALYYPWLIVRDPNVDDARISVPPSGHVAGQYAFVGATRGVHVAPANIPLRNVIGLTHYANDGDQDLLNPVGINTIRFFPGEGIRVWGCRTLWSVADGRHYVNVRRLLNFVKESIRRGNRWAVMQPNDPRLWTQIENVNSEFLYSLWDRGMLFPSTDVTRAYFVKCDNETNPMAEIKAGRVLCEIGINPPYPAEFVIFRIGLWDGGTSIAEEIARRG